MRLSKTRLTIVRATSDAFHDGSSISRILLLVKCFLQCPGVDVDGVVQVSGVDRHLKHLHLLLVLDRQTHIDFLLQTGFAYSASRIRG